MQHGILRAWAPAALALALVVCGATPAAALQGADYSMEILVDHRPLREHHARGRTYVEAREDAEYSVRLTNHTARRVAVALSVDGLNSIDARTTSARDGAKWILAPYESIKLDGWQTGKSTARRFFFTTEERSYGAWLGQTANLGIVSAAFFRERPRRPEPVPYSKREAGESGRRDQRSELDAPESRARAEGSLESEAPDGPPGLSDDLAATGIGREIRHRVRRVHFDAENRPATVLEVRYEYRDALVRLGVIPRDLEDRLSRRERARGFGDVRFAPDPYRGR